MGYGGENTLCICVPGSLKDVVPHSTILPRVKAYEMGSLKISTDIVSSQQFITTWTLENQLLAMYMYWI